MKNKKFFILFSILIIFIFQANLILGTRGFESGDLKISATYSVNKIHIYNTNPLLDWNKTMHTYDWCSGSGSIVDPYIIEDVEVVSNETGVPCLLIANSDVYFIVRNSIFTNSTDGFSGAILYDNVAYGKFVNNEVVDNDAGLFIDEGFDLFFSDNLFHNNTFVGMLIGESEEVTLSNNKISNSEMGVALGLSQYITIMDNEIYDCVGGLIYFSAYRYTAMGNNIHDNELGGFGMMESEFCVFSENILDNNNMSIYIMNDNYKNTITDNIIQNNEQYGVFIEDPLNSDNLIYMNYFYSNNISAMDNGTLNYWDNGEIGNYWDDYDGVDADNDGIGDTPFNITGSAGSIDNYPIWEEKAKDDWMFWLVLVIGFFIVISIAIGVVLAKDRRKAI